MRSGRVICVALGVFLIPSLLVGCGGPSEAEKAALAQPKVEIPAESKLAKPLKNESNRQDGDQRDRMPQSVNLPVPTTVPCILPA